MIGIVRRFIGRRLRGFPSVEKKEGRRTDHKSSRYNEAAAVKVTREQIQRSTLLPPNDSQFIIVNYKNCYIIQELVFLSILLLI